MTDSVETAPESQTTAGERRGLRVPPGGELFLSPQDLARRWGVSLHTIRDLRKRGRLPQPVPFPFRNLRWAKADIEAYESSLRGKTARRAVQYQQVSRHTGRDDE